MKLKEKLPKYAFLAVVIIPLALIILVSAIAKGISTVVWWVLKVLFPKWYRKRERERYLKIIEEIKWEK